MPKTFVLVHGAWHGGWCWRRVAEPLERQGHRVLCPTLTGLAERSHLLAPGIGLSTHIADIVNLFEWEGLDGVVLCGHSYAGLVIAGVAEQMHKRISGVVFLDAFAPDNGDNVVNFTSQTVRDRLAAGKAKGEIAIPPRPAADFGIDERDRAWVDGKLTPMPIATFTDKAMVTGAYERIGRKIYVRAPGYVSPGFDKAMARAEGDPSWRTYKADCGHDIMLIEPEWTAKILLEAV
jgi:pimeloyl-ACP methyl ester carboxylesterase